MKPDVFKALNTALIQQFYADDICVNQSYSRWGKSQKS